VGSTYLRPKDSNAAFGVRDRATGKALERAVRQTDRQTNRFFAHYSKIMRTTLGLYLYLSVALKLVYRAYVDSRVILYRRWQNVSATDADAGENAEIVYSLEFPWSDVDGFQVDSATGVITAARKFNREHYSNHALHFLVVATDRGRPDSRSATATAVVTIVDVNDEAPVFVDRPSDGVYELAVSENSPPGTVVGRVVARDADHGRNAVVTYTLSTPDDEGNAQDAAASAAFQMDRITGEIKTTRMLDREEREIFRLEVTASDGASPPLSSEVGLLIRVQDENDNRPQFVIDSSDSSVNVFDAPAVTFDDLDAEVSHLVSQLINKILIWRQLADTDEAVGDLMTPHTIVRVL